MVLESEERKRYSTVHNSTQQTGKVFPKHKAVKATKEGVAGRRAGRRNAQSVTKFAEFVDDFGASVWLVNEFEN